MEYYDEFESSEFKKKWFNISLTSNNRGDCIIFRETFKEGPHAGQSNSIYIDLQIAKEALEALDLLMLRAEKYIKTQ